MKGDISKRGRSWGGSDKGVNETTRIHNLPDMHVFVFVCLFIYLFLCVCVVLFWYTFVSELKSEPERSVCRGREGARIAQLIERWPVNRHEPQVHGFQSWLLLLRMRV